MEIAVVIAIALVLLIANATATWKVTRDEFARRSQKIAQILAVWLLPVIGAILVFAIHRRSEPPSRQYRKPPDAGDDYGASGRSPISTLTHLDD